MDVVAGRVDVGIRKGCGSEACWELFESFFVPVWRQSEAIRNEVHNKWDDFLIRLETFEQLAHDLREELRGKMDQRIVSMNGEIEKFGSRWQSLKPKPADDCTIEDARKYAKQLAGAQGRGNDRIQNSLVVFFNGDILKGPVDLLRTKANDGMDVRVGRPQGTGHRASSGLRGFRAAAPGAVKRGGVGGGMCQNRDLDAPQNIVVFPGFASI